MLLLSKVRYSNGLSCFKLDIGGFAFPELLLMSSFIKNLLHFPILFETHSESFHFRVTAKHNMLKHKHLYADIYINQAVSLLVSLLNSESELKHNETEVLSF